MACPHATNWSEARGAGLAHLGRKQKEASTAAGQFSINSVAEGNNRKPGAAEVASRIEVHNTTAEALSFNPTRWMFRQRECRGIFRY